VERTRGPRDAERIAREGVRAGVDRLVVAGGDGTLSEVATGLLAAGLGGYVRIALLPLGTGGDFARTLEIPRDTDAAIACIAMDKTRSVDAGRVRYVDRAGREAVAYFVNVASLGISALVDEIVARTTRAFGGTVAFLLATLRGLASYRSGAVELRVDGELVSSDSLVLAVAANGRYFGGGMHVAPAARPDDGCFDVVVVPDLGRATLLKRLPELYRGTHVDSPDVRCLRGRVIEATAAAGTVPLELDGESLGSLPARIELLPDALTLLGPQG
jgi:diacylglycerol kinase (ATP)